MISKERMQRNINLRELFFEAIKTGKQGQTNLAEEAGLTCAQMSNWKNGKRDMNLGNFEKLLKHMNERSWQTFLNLLAAKELGDYTEAECIDQLSIFTERLSMLKREREKREQREHNRYKEVSIKG
jgi:hypothetical protein